MPFFLVRRELGAALLSSILLLAPTLGWSLCCDQPGSINLTPAQMNANLVCTLGANPCVVQAQTLAGPGSCAVSGCALDFGTRDVVFDGPFVVTSGTLDVDAASITVNKSITSTSPVATVDLAAHGASCGGSAGTIVVRQPIDISSTVPGLIRLVSDCGITLESGGQLVANASNGPGGTIDLRAGTTILQGGPLRATGSGSDGGAVALTAGDDVSAERAIDVRSHGDGEGGSITFRAGDRTLAGAVAGGALTVSADLLADGSTSSEGDSGDDGGGIQLEAAGPILVTANATIRANGGAPDGGGGALTLLTQQVPNGVLTALDGDVTLAGPVVLRGAPNGDGGDLDGLVGRSFVLQGSIDLSAGGDDAVAGNLILSTGLDARLEGTISANGRVTTATGGFVQVRTGIASDAATLTASRTIDLSAGAGSDSGEAVLSACRLSATSAALIDARSALSTTRPAITLGATETLTLAAGSRFFAPPGSSTLLATTAATTVSTAGVTFNPTVTTTVLPPGAALFPPCPACGDGIRQPGEPCDPGAGADGACCSGDCLTLQCPTPTPSPTPSATPTGLTPTPTPSPTRTPTATPTPTVTVTPPLPPIEPRPVLACARALTKGAAKLAASTVTFLEACSGEALACLALADAEQPACLVRAERRCASKFGKVLRVRRSFASSFTKACAGEPPVLPFALVRAPEVLAFATLDDRCAADVGLALTSPSAVQACVEHGACAAERALAVGVPHLADLLGRVFDTSSAGLCLGTPPPPAAVHPTRTALRCQRTLLAASRKLFVSQLRIAQRCYDSLLGCRVAGAPCDAIADRCRKKLAALTDPTQGPRARLGASAAKACGTLDPSTVFPASGLGFDLIGPPCVELGGAAPDTVAELAPCLADAYGCAAGETLRRSAPGIDAELARSAIALGDDYACPTAVPGATPTVTPGPNGTPTPTPTQTATPTPVATANPVSVVLPGGGSATTDCVAEWTALSAPIDPPPTNTLTCIDGDPSCDQDGQADDRCVISLAVCLTGTDPRLPACPAASGLVSFALQNPQPDSADPLDAGNADALLAALGTLLGAAPGGSGDNTFFFDPAVVLTPPNHCTAPATITISRRGLDSRTERFRSRALGTGPGGVIEDSDTLYLTCARPGS